MNDNSPIEQDMRKAEVIAITAFSFAMFGLLLVGTMAYLV